MAALIRPVGGGEGFATKLRVEDAVTTRSPRLRGEPPFLEAQVGPDVALDGAGMENSAALPNARSSIAPPSAYGGRPRPVFGIGGVAWHHAHAHIDANDRTPGSPGKSSRRARYRAGRSTLALFIPRLDLRPRARPVGTASRPARLG